MGNWTIKSSKVSKVFELVTDALLTNGTFSVDERSGEVLAVNGACYRKNPYGQGDLIGTFNGQRKDGKIEYSLSQMSRKDGMAVLDAIDEIEEHIKNNN